LLDVENHGEAWYVNPLTMKRSYLGRATDAFNIMRQFGLGISNADLNQIGVIGLTGTIGDTVPPNALATKLSGRILLQVEENGEAWYVYPGNLRRYYLGRPDDAYNIMRSLGLGITSANLAKVAIESGSLVPPVNGRTYQSYTLTNSRGSFPVRVITLRRDSFKMITDTAQVEDCERDCAAFPLKTYIEENGAAVGIHGAYACPPDYAECADQINAFQSPVFNSVADKMVNEDNLKFFDRPVMVATTDGELRYFHRASQFGNSVQEFESVTGTTVQSAIGNWPSLVENGISVAENEPTEDKFVIPATRGGIGYNADNIFLVVATNATMVNFASIFVTLGATNALNLDGGGTTAMYLDGAYKFGPGRLLSNVILFKEK
jgi:hypothetical protein